MNDNHVTLGATVIWYRMVEINGDSNKTGNVLWRNIETPFPTIVAVEKQQVLYSFWRFVDRASQYIYLSI